MLLTGSMAMGLLSSVRFQRPDWPRFVTLGLHRNLSLLALAFTVVHVLTTVLDSFVAIPLQDAFIPFISSYRPIWLGLGAIAFDLMLALIITSLLRGRMGLRAGCAGCGAVVDSADLMGFQADFAAATR